MRRLWALGLLFIAGCRHNLVVINAGVANKSASALSAAMTPEAYCIALTSPNLIFNGKPAPKMSTEQQDFCREVLRKEAR